MSTNNTLSSNLFEEDELESRGALEAKEIADDDFQEGIRPVSLDNFIGQRRVCDNLKIAIGAAKKRDSALDHILFYGPPGLGKTTFAGVIAAHRGVSLKTTSGPILERPGDLAAVLSGLDAHDVLFIDEIHRLPSIVEEVLYPAMEDFFIDIMVGQGPAARSVKLDLAPFTLVGATTRVGSLSSPLRHRFGITERVEYYNEQELFEILQRTARVLSIEVEDEGIWQIAKRSRGTPRIANRLLRRARDYGQERAQGVVTEDVAKKALSLLDIDLCGLDAMDRAILQTIIEKFSGGPVGVDTIAASLSEERVTIEDVYEPYLLQRGFLQRTPRGRIATERAFKYFSKNTMPSRFI